MLWCLIGLDLWSVGVAVDIESILAPELSKEMLVSWRWLHLVFGAALSFALWLAYRQVLQVRHTLDQQLALQRLIVDHTAEAMLVTDGAQRILSVNAAFEQITGHRASEVLGLTPTVLSAGHHGLAVHRTIWDFVAEHGFWAGEIWDRRKDGTLYPKQMRITAICQPDTQTSHFVAVFSDVSEEKAQAERFDYLARHDLLTKLPNRLSLDSHLCQLLENAVPGIERLALVISISTTSRP